MVRVNNVDTILNRHLQEVELGKGIWRVCTKPNVAIHGVCPLTPHPHCQVIMEADALVLGGRPSAEGNADLSDVAEWVHCKS